MPSETTAAELDTVEALGDDFPKWHIWRGHSGITLGGWYATRRQPLSDMEYHAGLYRTLGADDPGDLRKQLEQQTSRETSL